MEKPFSRVNRRRRVSGHDTWSMAGVAHATSVERREPACRIETPRRTVSVRGIQGRGMGRRKTLGDQELRDRLAARHAAGRVHDVALTDTADLKGWRVFLCGHPDMVQQAQMRAYLAGASLADIHADAFQLSPRAST